MGRILAAGVNGIIAGVALVPILLVLNGLIFKSTKRTLIYIIFGMYFTAVLAVVGLPNVTYVRFQPIISLVPLVYVLEDLNSNFLNILLFVPFGLALPCLWRKFGSIKQVVLHSFSLSLIIEFLQIFTYRATDIDDLIMNTLGGVIGFLVAKLLIDRVSFIKPKENHSHFYIIAVVVFLVMFFVEPFTSPLILGLIG